MTIEEEFVLPSQRVILMTNRFASKKDIWTGKPLPCLEMEEMTELDEQRALLTQREAAIEAAKNGTTNQPSVSVELVDPSDTTTSSGE